MFLKTQIQIAFLSDFVMKTQFVRIEIWNIWPGDFNFGNNQADILVQKYTFPVFCITYLLGSTSVPNVQQCLETCTHTPGLAHYKTVKTVKCMITSMIKIWLLTPKVLSALEYPGSFLANQINFTAVSIIALDANLLYSIILIWTLWSNVYLCRMKSHLQRKQ